MRHLFAPNMFQTMDGNDEYNSTIYADENAPATIDSDDNHSSVVNHLIVVLLFCITILINTALCVPSFINRRRRQRQWEAYRARIVVVQIANNEQNMSPEEVQRIEATRYNSIENWVVSKQIHAHDDLCSKCLMADHNTTAASATAATTTATPCSSSSSSSKDSVKQRIKTAGTVDMTDEEWGAGEDDDAGDEVEGGHECPICFEEFQVGDVISWSPESTTSCTHMFHHACIKEWLLKNAGCPFCRATVLPVDRLLLVRGGGGQQTTPGLHQIAELLQAQEHRKKSQQDCFYCIDHGIVKLPNNSVHRSRAGCPLLTLEEMEQATKRARDVPSKQVLVEMRRVANGDGEMAKPPLPHHHVTESVTTTASTIPDNNNNDNDDENDQRISSESSSSSAAEAVSSSWTTCRLDVIPGDFEDNGDGQTTAESSEQRQTSAENNEVKSNAATADCEAPSEKVVAND
jgi:Ring finger domain